MSQLLTLAVQVLLDQYKITDAASCQAFLREFMRLIRARAAQTKVQLNLALMRNIEFVLSNNALFTYIYRTIIEQLQTPEILCESVNDEMIVKLVDETKEQSPEAIDPVVIISLVSQIVSVINAIKARRNR